MLLPQQIRNTPLDQHPLQSLNNTVYYLLESCACRYFSSQSFKQHARSHRCLTSSLINYNFNPSLNLQPQLLEPSGELATNSILEDPGALPAFFVFYKTQVSLKFP